MTEQWPILTDVKIQGAQTIERVLRPPNPAQIVSRDDFNAAVEAVRRACDSWSGAYMPLVPVEPGKPIDRRWADLLDGSPVEGITRTELVDPVDQFGFGIESDIGSGMFLLRQLMNLKLPEEHLTVQTAHGADVEDPWFLSYLGTFGDFPKVRSSDVKRIHEIRDDFDYENLVPVEGVGDKLGAEDLLSRVRDTGKISAVQLTLSGLSSISAGLNMGLPTDRSVELDRYAAARKFGPNVVVVYEPGSVEDLALLWYLRALHGFPAGLPLAVPASVDVTAVLTSWVAEHAYSLWGFAGGGKTVVSASVSPERLQEFVAGTPFRVSSPDEVLMPFGGCGLFSTEVAHYSNGRAEIPRFMPSDREAIGQRALENAGRWSTVTAVVKDDVLPPSRTLRRECYPNRGYLQGYCASASTSDGVIDLYHPTGIEVLNALAKDHGQTIRRSSPGRVAEQLISRIGGMQGMHNLACPTVTQLLTQLTRGRNSTVIKRQLRHFLQIDDAEATAEDRYKLIEERLDKALAQPDVEDTAYKTISQMNGFTKLGRKPTLEWVRWACRQGLLMRGFEAACRHCDHKQWRPLVDLVPELTCHGCGKTIEEPLGSDQTNLRYRASENTLRAMNSDVMSHVLALRYLVAVWDGHGGRHNVYGSYPGVEIIDSQNGSVAAEADVIIVLANGRWVVGECKTSARGLREDDLDKLNEFAARIDAAATFVATLESSAECSEIWQRTSLGSGRPHFALTAEHLYDLSAITVFGQDPLAWRPAYRSLTSETTVDTVVQEFAEFLIPEAEDQEAYRRAPWVMRNA